MGRPELARLRRLEAVFESAVDFAIVAMDRDGRITDWNPGAERVLGWPAVEAVGQAVDLFFTPEDRAAARSGAEMRSALAEGRAQDERWHLRRDGSRFWASGEMMPLRDEDGEHLGFLKILRDRTEKRQLGQALEESEARFRGTFEQAAVGAAHVALDGRWLRVNARLCAMLGYSEGELLARTFQDITHPDDLSADLDNARALVAGEIETYSMEKRYVCKDGALLWINLTVSLLRDGGGLPQHFISIVEDVSARKEAEEALRRLNLVLEARVEARTRELMQAEEKLRQSQKMEAVGQLTGGLAHDFNNLLTGISGSLELMQARIAQGRVHDVDRYVIAAQGEARRAAALTHRLLAFSRRQTLDPRPTNLNRLVAGIDELVRRTVGPAVTVELVAAGGLWATLVDPNQLENALLNLCLNARDAMPEGGRLTVETGNRWLDARGARERELAPGQYVSLCVSDTGSGMAPEVMARAFDPFFTTKPIGLGTGLGLSMVYGFARQSGGQVRIYSEPNQGTMVCIYLPRHAGAADDLQADAAVLVPELARSGQSKTVLVVDDEPTVRMLVTEVLEELGHVAIEAADGAAGLRVLRSDMRLDLLITDVGLPDGMNGRQVADAGRAVRPGLQVLFITGYAENAVVGHGHLEAGMHLLTKPFAMDALASRVREMVAG